MFDIAKFAEGVCDAAYPNWFKRDSEVPTTPNLGEPVPTPEDPENPPGDIIYKENRFKYRVVDIFGDDVAKGNRKLVQVKWRLNGMERGGLDEPLTRSVNFELLVSASEVIVLNAFHYALMIKVRQTYSVDLSDIVGDVEEDEPVGRTTRESGRVYRVWGLRVDDLVTGMQPLFEMKED